MTVFALVSSRSINDNGFTSGQYRVVDMFWLRVTMNESSTMTIRTFWIIRIQGNKDICEAIDIGNIKGFDSGTIDIQNICDKIKRRETPPRSIMFFGDYIIERGGIF